MCNNYVECVRKQAAIDMKTVYIDAIETYMENADDYIWEKFKNNYDELEDKLIKMGFDYSNVIDKWIEDMEDYHVWEWDDSLSIKENVFQMFANGDELGYCYMGCCEMMVEEVEKFIEEKFGLLKEREAA